MLENVHKVKMILSMKCQGVHGMIERLGPPLLTWFNFNPGMDK